MATLTNNKLIPCCTRDPEFSIEYDKLAELSGEMVTYDDGDGHFDEIWQPKISDSDLELLDKKYPLKCSKNFRHGFDISLLKVK